jgi:DNA-binding response OmpR family regulator
MLAGETIMVVEDDDATRAFLADNLKADSYGVVTASSARQALNLLEVKECALMLLDVMLPDASGFELCRRLREADGLAQRVDPQLPVIMLTGRSSETDRVRGFARGADDYVVKPFHYPELAARVDAVLRRSKGRQGQGLLQVGELRIDPVAREVTLAERKVELSAKEFALLRTLAGEPTRVFTKEELLRDVWGFKLMGINRHIRYSCRSDEVSEAPRWSDPCFSDRPPRRRVLPQPEAAARSVREMDGGERRRNRRLARGCRTLGQNHGQSRRRCRAWAHPCWSDGWRDRRLA